MTFRTVFKLGYDLRTVKISREEGRGASYHREEGGPRSLITPEEEGRGGLKTRREQGRGGLKTMRSRVGYTPPGTLQYRTVPCIPASRPAVGIHPASLPCVYRPAVYIEVLDVR